VKGYNNYIKGRIDNLEKQIPLCKTKEVRNLLEKKLEEYRIRYNRI
jgi:hypothetical protein